MLMAPIYPSKDYRANHLICYDTIKIFLGNLDNVLVNIVTMVTYIL